MTDPREQARTELILAVVSLGHPPEFGEVLANELGGEKSLRRLAAYLRQARPTSPEQVVDEMLAIKAQRKSWVEKKVSERANAKMTEFYNRPRNSTEG